MSVLRNESNNPQRQEIAEKRTGKWEAMEEEETLIVNDWGKKTAMLLRLSELKGATGRRHLTEGLGGAQVWDRAQRIFVITGG